MQHTQASAAPVGCGAVQARKENAMGTDRARGAFIPVVLTVATLLGVLEVTAERGANSVPSPASSSWSTSRHAMEAALARGSWQAFLAAGDGALRLGEATQGRDAAEPDGRRLFLAALFLARSQHSLDGVLRATEAFVRLGDHEVVA